MTRRAAERIDRSTGATVAEREALRAVGSAALARHAYVRRECGDVVDEEPFAEWIVRLLDSTAGGDARSGLAGASADPSRRMSCLDFDAPLVAELVGRQRFLEQCGVELADCYDPPERFDTLRKIFERRIRYWHCRPMPEDESYVVSPADARVLVGSLATDSSLHLEDRFFEIEGLLALEKRVWSDAFAAGDVAICRLTPDKYHYNHVPVSGVVIDFYEIDVASHTPQPSAVVATTTPFAKGPRSVTVIDTDVPGGSQVGRVAMVEIVAATIGEVVQCYSETLYDDPLPVHRGMFLERGAPKSLFRPGSSIDVLLFEPGRIRFAADLVAHRFDLKLASHLSAAFGAPFVETDVAVRSPIARRVGT